MFLITLILAIIFAIPTYGISIIVFIAYYSYQTIRQKNIFINAIKTLPNGSSNTDSYFIKNLSYIRTIAYIDELCTNKTIGEKIVIFDYFDGNDIYRIECQEYNQKVLLKKVGITITILLYNWLREIQYYDGTPKIFAENPEKTINYPNDIIQIERIVLGYAHRPEYPYNIGEIPEYFYILKNLKELHLQYNQLTSLSESIGNLENLVELKLGGNELKTLPRNIGKLKKLRILTMWRNEIEFLPAEICLLKNLQGLDLCDNPIEFLPNEITNLKNLKALFLPKNIILNDYQKEWIEYLKNNNCKVHIS